MNTRGIKLACTTAAMLFGMCANSVAADKFLFGYEESTAKTSDPNPVTIVTPVVTDVQVNGDKISYQKTFENKLDQEDIDRAKVGDTPLKVEAWKRDVLAEASTKYNADVIVAPNFIVKTSVDYKTVTITLTGYPAKYVNFRSATKEDITVWRYFHNVEPPTIIK